MKGRIHVLILKQLIWNVAQPESLDLLNQTLYQLVTKLILKDTLRNYLQIYVVPFYKRFAVYKINVYNNVGLEVPTLIITLSVSRHKT